MTLGEIIGRTSVYTNNEVSKDKGQIVIRHQKNRKLSQRAHGILTRVCDSL